MMRRHTSGAPCYTIRKELLSKRRRFLLAAMARASKKKSRSSQTKTKKTASAKTNREFPKLKDVLFKPERLRYVRKIVRSESCVFCDAMRAGAQVESLLLGVHGEAMAILNKYPYNNGHLLVLPTRHVGNFGELTRAELADTQWLLQKAYRVLTEVYSPSGFNVGLNLGAAAGAGIPEHLHWHLIPRWSGDTNFFPLIAETKVVVETIEDTFERLRPHFA